MFKILPNTLISFNSTASAKCGEIFCQSSNDFTIRCNFCEIKCFNFEDFVMHLRNIHFENDLIKTDDLPSIKHKINVNVNTKYNDNNTCCEEDKEQFIIEQSHKDLEDCNWSWSDAAINSESDDEYKPQFLAKKPATVKEHKCDTCDKIYKNFQQLKLHIKRKHEQNSNENTAATINLKCIECDKSFNTQKSLDKHIVSEHSGFKCPNCNKVFKFRLSLNRHLIMHSGVKNFVCDFESCQKRFYTKRHLTAHKQLHTDIKNFVCDKCAYSCRNNETLVIHYRMHTGEKPYLCNICQKGFASSSLLSEHKASHATDRPHVCDVCGATFSRPKALYHHKHLHLGIKKFVCKLCGKAYAQAAGLACHMRKHKKEMC